MKVVGFLQRVDKSGDMDCTSAGGLVANCPAKAVGISVNGKSPAKPSHLGGRPSKLPVQPNHPQQTYRTTEAAE